MIVFFFQAEDGIRDLVRSRGLGDVYKRQASPFDTPFRMQELVAWTREAMADKAWHPLIVVGPVSYTHLTLPTSDLV